MKKRTILFLLFAAALMAFSGIGCGGDDEGTPTDGDVTDGDEDGDVEEEPTGPLPCTDDSFCPDGQACDDFALICKDKVCDSDSWCQDNVDLECTNGQAAQVVCGDDGLCYPAKCTNNGQCESGNVCDGGACCEGFIASDVDSCVLNASTTLLRSEMEVTLSAVAYHQSGAVVDMPMGSYTWATSDDTIVAVDGGVVTGGDTTGDATITATIGGATCEVAFSNFGEVTADKVRVIVADIKSGAFLQGVKVVIGEETVESDANGVAELDMPAEDFDVHAFHEDYVYMSVFQVSIDDIFLPLEPIPDATKCGGIKGEVDFSKIPEALKEEIRLAITTMQISGNLLDIDFMSLLGEMIMTHIKLGSVVDEDVALPSGIELFISKTPVMQGFKATGPEGAAVAWSFGGYIPLSDLISIVTNAMNGSDIADIEIGKVVSEVMPFFDTFYHGLKPGLNVELFDKVADVDDINGNEDVTELVCDFSKFQDLGSDLALNQPLNGQTVINFQSLPAGMGDGAGGIAIMAADVTGVGIVPLGLTLSLDEDAEGNFDGKLGDNGEVTMNYALQHSGVTGYDYFLLTAAVDVEGLIASEAEGDINVSLAIKTFADAPATVTMEAFPSFLTATLDMPNRSFDMQGEATAGDLARVLLDEGGKWAVYMPVGYTAVLPAVPEGMMDRMIDAESHAFISSIDLSGDLDYEGLIGFTAQNLNQLNYLTDGLTITVKN
jgi:hypothetical protein